MVFQIDNIIHVCKTYHGIVYREDKGDVSMLMALGKCLTTQTVHDYVILLQELVVAEKLIKMLFYTDKINGSKKSG